ncbi:hypothetical protein GCM10025881_33170 [Pseudolysinimonas kribbensis]|uniref:valine--tRNA ligase n=1 Tax=Pseudolysinimonas kribbensis TaxID=433641 RepID=A0ABQ6K763_9MICO|nr:hypothetical protein GCM10025881_33170 [Pseudolysinimonas kribbensis]
MTSAIPGPAIPERPALEGLEQKWSADWEQAGVYRFDRAAALEAGRAALYSIDTPPPTASGSLHIGHVFSYTHMDLAARFQRMRGKHLFYPMGWDDNGLPTERRVQNYYGVRCDPSLPYVADFTPPHHGDGSGKPADQVPVSRRNFIELCERLTEEDEVQFEDLWRALGLSVDWSLTYRTIGAEAQRAAQRGFLRNLARGEAYQADAPPSGTSRSVPRWRRPSSRIATSRARTTASHSTRPTAPPCSSRPRDRSCCPRAWPSSRIPTTSATRRCSAPP